MNADSDPSDDSDHVDLETASRLCGLPAEMILEFSRTRIVSVVQTAAGEPPRFDDASLLRLRRIESLHLDWSLPPPSIRMVMELFDRLESAERELRALRERHR